jgi:Flp pilus assembly pilin Flp
VTPLYPFGVIFEFALQGSPPSGFFIHATRKKPHDSTKRISPLNAAEGRCNRMKLRDWIELLRIQLHREEGQTMAEYGVVLALITLAVVGVITVLGTSIAAAITSVTSNL